METTARQLKRSLRKRKRSESRSRQRTTRSSGGQSPLRLIRFFEEFRLKDEVTKLPVKLRGIYVLYKRVRGGQKFDVQYVGMAAAGRRRGIKGRLTSHAKKKTDWTHFSAYVVWDNIREEEIVELEGLFRHIYRKDSRASALNVQRRFKKLRQVEGIFSKRGKI